MIWSIDIELDELVVESRYSEGTLGNEHQKNSERDKQAVADLVKKLLVCDVACSFVHNTEQLSYRSPELSSQVPAERGSIVAWFSLPVLVLTSRTGTSERSERGRVFCWFDPTLRAYSR